MYMELTVLYVLSCMRASPEALPAASSDGIRRLVRWKCPKWLMPERELIS